jgi:uncharacterized membrane protein
MGEILTALMRWVHISSAVTLIGGIFYARFIMLPAAAALSGDARTTLDEQAAARFRPVMYAAMAGLIVAGTYKLLASPGHSALYHALFGIKILLALHVFAVAILTGAAHNPRRPRQLFGAAVSGVVVLLISAYLKGIA